MRITLHQRLLPAVSVAAASLVLASSGSAAGVTPSTLHPDDRADRTLTAATLYGGPLDRYGMDAGDGAGRATAALPDDRADRTLPPVAIAVPQAGAADAFDWSDAGIGAAAGVVILAAGGAIGTLRRRRPAAAAVTRSAS